MDINSLAHTKWNCKYHIVFAPKYRRKIIYGQLKRDIANILSMLCKRKGVKIVEASSKISNVSIPVLNEQFSKKSLGCTTFHHLSDILFSYLLGFP